MSWSSQPSHAQHLAAELGHREREKHQTKNYFKELVEEVGDVDALAVFGPAETFEKFKRELEQSYKELNAKVKIVRRADSMTDNQVKALVRDFFENEYKS